MYDECVYIYLSTPSSCTALAPLHASSYIYVQIQTYVYVYIYICIYIHIQEKAYVH